MSLGGINAGFDSTNPGDGDNEGLGAGVIRSFKTTVQQVLDSEHNFPAAGGASTGYHRFGSARPFYDVQSNVSSSGTDARLMQTSDTSRLFHVGSGGTSFIGGATAIMQGAYPGTVPQRFYWAMECGAINAPLNASCTTTLNFPNSGFSGMPFTTCSACTQAGLLGGTSLDVVLTGLSATQAIFTSRYITTSLITGASGHTIFWQSIGTRTF